MKFFTRFNPAVRKSLNKKYDEHDNVDRISYMDSTALVNRFIAEGRSLSQFRAQALRSGAYSGDMDEIEKDTGIPTPVYQSDPVVVAPIIEKAKEQLESRVSGASNELNDRASRNSDSDKAVKSSSADGASSAASAE